MEIYFSFQAALCFSIAHIFIRRGLVESNAMTGSFISLSTTATVLWLLFPFFAGLSDLWTPAPVLLCAKSMTLRTPGRRSLDRSRRICATALERALPLTVQRRR
jgi:hypothetical protein